MHPTSRPATIQTSRSSLRRMSNALICLQVTDLHTNQRLRNGRTDKGGRSRWRLIKELSRANGWHTKNTSSENTVSPPRHDVESLRTSLVQVTGGKSHSGCGALCPHLRHGAAPRLERGEMRRFSRNCMEGRLVAPEIRLLARPFIFSPFSFVPALQVYAQCCASCVSCCYSF
jgi:hypothetical protein